MKAYCLQKNTHKPTHSKSRLHHFSNLHEWRRWGHRTSVPCQSVCCWVWFYPSSPLCPLVLILWSFLHPPSPRSTQRTPGHHDSNVLCNHYLPLTPTCARSRSNNHMLTMQSLQTEVLQGLWGSQERLEIVHSVNLPLICSTDKCTIIIFFQWVWSSFSLTATPLKWLGVPFIFHFF